MPGGLVFETRNLRKCRKTCYKFFGQFRFIFDLIFAKLSKRDVSKIRGSDLSKIWKP